MYNNQLFRSGKWSRPVPLCRFEDMRPVEHRLTNTIVLVSAQAAPESAHDAVFSCLCLEACKRKAKRWGKSRGPPQLWQMTYALTNNHGFAKGAAMCHGPVKDSLGSYHAVWRSRFCIVTRISLQLTHVFFFNCPRQQLKPISRAPHKPRERNSFGTVYTLSYLSPFTVVSARHTVKLLFTSSSCDIQYPRP